ncbi:putative oxysterol-binding protein-related protein 1D [Sesbania bispinosa]|nr:putative oxysterol-binding protein-related protein 1D [Sesbania bispinosa]
MKVIGEESLKYMKKANWNLNRAIGGGGGTIEQCKPFGEMHFKVFIIDRVLPVIKIIK